MIQAIKKIIYKYPSLPFADNFLSGHLNITKRITVFGKNAMHWSITVYGTKWGALHIDLPTWSRITGKRGWCVYASPNGTPWACTWYIGNKDKAEHIRAQIRRFHFGHNNKNIYSVGEYSDSPLYRLNNDMDDIVSPLSHSKYKLS